MLSSLLRREPIRESHIEHLCQRGTLPYRETLANAASEAGGKRDERESIVRGLCARSWRLSVDWWTAPQIADYLNIATSQYRNIAISQHRNIATSQYRNIVIFEKHNIRDGVRGQVAGASPDSQATFQGSGSYVSTGARSSGDHVADDQRRDSAVAVLAVVHRCGGFRFLTIVSASADPLTISNISLAITFMPHWDALRAYPGYFYTPDPGFHDIDFLAKILYASTYTVQNNTIPPRMVRQGPWPAGGGWSNDALGGSVTGPILVDGAKRDRNIWAGDCGISTHTELVALSDTEPTKNSLTVMFGTQNPTTGALQYEPWH
ncbi:unnamed protein product [Mycena citricolor]|uniref:Uncharacterized protein n=1 Tax=Mycena citricolor TaxID=2018698 RepID=A0AAD2K3Q4_9AGAR|nr:unnamed protein product [Mycena citricolor]